MTTQSALSDAKSTCDGLHRLIRKISQAAIDIDKGGSSSYEMLALIASANTCVINLATQLTILETGDTEDSNVLPLKRQTTEPLDDSDHSHVEKKNSASK